MAHGTDSDATRGMLRPHQAESSSAACDWCLYDMPARCANSARLAAFRDWVRRGLGRGAEARLDNTAAHPCLEERKKDPSWRPARCRQLSCQPGEGLSGLQQSKEPLRAYQCPAGNSRLSTGCPKPQVRKVQTCAELALRSFSLLGFRRPCKASPCKGVCA